MDEKAEQATATQVFAGLAAMVVSAVVAWRAWSWLWSWRGLDEQGAQSVWNQQPFYALLMLASNAVWTLLAFAIAAIVSYAVTWGVLRAVQFVGRRFMEGFMESFR